MQKSQKILAVALVAAALACVSPLAAETPEPELGNETLPAPTGAEPSTPEIIEAAETSAPSLDGEVISTENVTQLGVIVRIGSIGQDVLDVAFSPDSALIAGPLGGNDAGVWSVSDGELVHELSGHTSRVSSVAFSPDGSLLATGSWDQNVILWDLATGEQVLTFDGHASFVNTIAFSPDGSLIVSGSDEGLVLVWSAADGSILHSKDEIILQPQRAAFSPDGQLFAVSTLEPSIYMWRVDDGELFMRPTGLSNVRSIVYSADGLLLAAGSSNYSNETGEPLARTIIWDASTFEILVRTDRTISSLDLSFSPDSSLLVSSSGDGGVFVWDAGDGSLLRMLPGMTARSWANAFSPDGARIAAGSDAGEIIIWGVPGE